MLRAKAANAWNSRNVTCRSGRKDARTGRFLVDVVHLTRESDLTILTWKDTEEVRQEHGRLSGVDIVEIPVAEAKPHPQSPLGSVLQIPAALAYAVTIHKGQGLTIKTVRAVLEGLFAHGQVYVQNPRTPFERNFMCVGVCRLKIFAHECDVQ